MISLFAAVALSSFISLLGATVLACIPGWKMSWSRFLTAFSSGILLSTALLHLGPEAVEHLGGEIAFQGIFAAIVFFFVLERLVLWYHHHHDSHSKVHPSAFLVMVGDSIHNMLDGVLIAGIFLVDPVLGWVSALTVAAHEIPQEIADFTIMINAGISRKKALVYNALSAGMALLGAGIGWYFLANVEHLTSLATAFGAGMFLYIALSDLIPELHEHSENTSERWGHLVCLLLGIVLMWTVFAFTPHIELDTHSQGAESEHAQEVEDH